MKIVKNETMPNSICRLCDVKAGEVFRLHDANEEWKNQPCIRLAGKSAPNNLGFVRLSDGHIEFMGPRREVVMLEATLAWSDE